MPHTILPTFPARRPLPHLSPTQPTNPNPILPWDFLPHLCSFSTPEHVNIHLSIWLYITDLISTAWHHCELDGTLLGVCSVEDAEALVCAHCVLGTGNVGSALIERTAALSVSYVHHCKHPLSLLVSCVDIGKGTQALRLRDADSISQKTYHHTQTSLMMSWFRCYDTTGSSVNKSW